MDLKNIDRKRAFEYAGIAILLFVTLLLRVPNLGYSDYHGDEFKAQLKIGEEDTLKDFLLDQRKGPLQFLISYIQYNITGTYQNELFHRIPFTAFGIMSIFVFYGFTRKLTKDSRVAFISTFLLTVTGFIVGFARIAQYQNLNLFFSFASLYFFVDLVQKKDNLIRSSLLGTLMLILSLLAHWDAIFIVPIITIFLIKFLLNKEISQNYKVKLVLANFGLGLLILGPLILEYLPSQLGDSDNMRYFKRRVSTGYDSLERFKYLINLYNPFVSYWFYIVIGLIGLLFIKKTWMYTLWFGIVFALFQIFFRKPGTHIYNFIIPIFIIGSIGLVKLVDLLPKLLKWVLVGALTVIFSFFVYQSYVIFVDHTVEYPWEQEKFFSFLCINERDRLGKLTKCGEFVSMFETSKYLLEDKPPMFGFTTSKEWNQIHDYIIGMNTLNGERFQYVTNEDKSLSDRYLGIKYGMDGGYYAIAIKRPQSLVNDWSMENHKGKKLVHTIDNENGEEVVRIYRIEPKD